MPENDLELVDTETLVKELQRRSNALLIVIDDDDDGNKGRLRVYSPSHPLMALGMVEYARLAVERSVA